MVTSGMAADIAALLSSTSARTFTIGVDKSGRILQHDRAAGEVLSDGARPAARPRARQSRHRVRLRQRAAVADRRGLLRPRGHRRADDQDRATAITPTRWSPSSRSARPTRTWSRRWCCASRRRRRSGSSTRRSCGTRYSTARSPGPAERSTSTRWRRRWSTSSFRTSATRPACSCWRAWWARTSSPATRTRRQHLVRRLAVAHDDDDPGWDATFPIGEILSYPPDTPYTRCLDTGKPVMMDLANNDAPTRSPAACAACRSPGC